MTANLVRSRLRTWFVVATVRGEPLKVELVANRAAGHDADGDDEALPDESMEGLLDGAPSEGGALVEGAHGRPDVLSVTVRVVGEGEQHQALGRVTPSGRSFQTRVETAIAIGRAALGAFPRLDPMLLQPGVEVPGAIPDRPADSQVGGPSALLPSLSQEGYGQADVVTGVAFCDGVRRCRRHPFREHLFCRRGEGLFRCRQSSLRT